MNALMNARVSTFDATESTANDHWIKCLRSWSRLPEHSKTKHKLILYYLYLARTTNTIHRQTTIIWKGMDKQWLGGKRRLSTPCTNLDRNGAKVVIVGLSAYTASSLKIVSSSGCSRPVSSFVVARSQSIIRARTVAAAMASSAACSGVTVGNGIRYRLSTWLIGLSRNTE